MDSSHNRAFSLWDQSRVSLDVSETTPKEKARKKSFKSEYCGFQVFHLSVLLYQCCPLGLLWMWKPSYTMQMLCAFEEENVLEL